MAILKGFKKSIQIAEESTYGVKATTGWKALEVDTEALAKNVPEFNPVGLRGGIAGYIRRVQGPTDVTGTLAGDVYPEGGFPLLLKCAMGSVASVQQGGTSAWTHTASIVDNIIYGETKGLTVKADRDLRVLDNYGMVVNSFTINSASGNTPAKYSFDLVGKEQETGSSSSPVFTTASPFMHHQAQFSLDSSAVQIQNWTITMNNNYKTDVYGAGSSRVFIPRGGYRDVTGSITFPVIENLDIYDKFIAGTSASLTITYTGALIEAPYSYSMVITIPILKYNGPTAPGSGGLETPMIECPFRCYATNSATLEMTIAITSTETSI